MSDTAWSGQARGGARPPHRTGWRGRTFAAVVALLAFLAPTSAVALPATASPASDPATATATATATIDGTAPVLTLQELTPAVAHPGDDLSVTVEVTNPTAQTITGASLELAVDWRRFFRRDDLAGWASGDLRRLLTAQRVESLPDIGPGESTTVTFELPVDELGLAEGLRGARPLSVTLDDGDDDGDGDDAELRTFLLWDPRGAEAGADADPVRLTLLAPLTGPSLNTTDPTSPSALAGHVAPGGPLARVLAAVDTAEEATGTRGALCLAVDPALVAAAADSDDPQVSAWAGTVASVGTRTEVHPLPPYDPDFGALARAGLSAGGVAAAATTPLPGWQMPDTWGDPLGWAPGPDAADLTTLSAMREAGLDTVVMPSGLRPVSGTSTGLATVPTEHGDLTAIVADEPLSQTLAATTDMTGTTTTALGVQRLLAETAVISARGAGAEPHVVAVMPRGWAPDLDALGTALSTLSGGGWVRLTPLEELRATPVPDLPRTPLADVEPHEGELSPDDVRQLAAARESLATLASVATDAAALTGPLGAALAAPASVASRANPDARQTAVSAAVDAVNAARGALTVAAADVTLISASGALPVLVSNDLPVDATVVVRLRPDDPRLVVDAEPTLTIPAGESRSVEVPVSALGSGDVVVEVQALTPDGAQAATPISLTLQVRAGWETAGTAVAAVVVGLLFVAGIWRTVRRGRSSRRTVDSDVTDPVIPADAGRP